MIKMEVQIKWLRLRLSSVDLSSIDAAFVVNEQRGRMRRDGCGFFVWFVSSVVSSVAILFFEYLSILQILQLQIVYYLEHTPYHLLLTKKIIR